MKKLASNRKKIAAYKGSIMPKILDRLKHESKLVRHWLPRYIDTLILFFLLFIWSPVITKYLYFFIVIRWAGDKLFEVRHTSALGEQFVVNIDKRECTCRKWSVSGIPCCHALCVIKFLNINAEDFIPDCFKKCTYEQTYASIVYPINGEQVWEVTSYLDVMPPKKRILSGRPKKKRRLEPWELKKDDTQMSNGGFRKRCSVCRQLGHNRKYCPIRPQQTKSQPAPQSGPTPGPSQPGPTGASSQSAPPQSGPAVVAPPQCAPSQSAASQSGPATVAPPQSASSNSAPSKSGPTTIAPRKSASSHSAPPQSAPPSQQTAGPPNTRPTGAVQPMRSKLKARRGRVWKP